MSKTFVGHCSAAPADPDCDPESKLLNFQLHVSGRTCSCTMLLSSPCRSCSSRWKPTRLAFRSSSLEESRSAASCWDPTAPSSSCRWSAAGPSADRLATFCSISRNISCTITQSQTVSSVLCSVVKIPAEALNEVIIMRTLLTEGQSESFKSSTVTHPQI